MKSLSSLTSKQNLLAVDPSTQRVAFSYFEHGSPEAWGVVQMEGELYDRLGQATARFGAILEEFNPAAVWIESAVFVNNRKVVIKLAYFYGALLSQAGLRNIPINTVAPISWMAHIGNSTWTKAEKEAKRLEVPKASNAQFKKYLREERKLRTINIVNERFPYLKVTDNDVADAIGLGIYAWDHRTENARE